MERQQEILAALQKLPYSLTEMGHVLLSYLIAENNKPSSEQRHVRPEFRDVHGMEIVRRCSTFVLNNMFEASGKVIQAKAFRRCVRAAAETRDSDKIYVALMLAKGGMGAPVETALIPALMELLVGRAPDSTPLCMTQDPVNAFCESVLQAHYDFEYREALALGKLRPIPQFRRQISTKLRYWVLMRAYNTECAIKMMECIDHDSTAVNLPKLFALNAKAVFVDRKQDWEAFHKRFASECQLPLERRHVLPVTRHLAERQKTWESGAKIMPVPSGLHAADAMKMVQMATFRAMGSLHVPTRKEWDQIDSVILHNSLYVFAEEEPTAAYLMSFTNLRYLCRTPKTYLDYQRLLQSSREQHTALVRETVDDALFQRAQDLDLKWTDEMLDSIVREVLSFIWRPSSECVLLTLQK